MSGPSPDAITMPAIAAAVMITVVSEVNFMAETRSYFLSQVPLRFYTRLDSIGRSQMICQLTQRDIIFLKALNNVPGAFHESF